MTVKELIELNSMICDARIEVREDGGIILEALYIGPSVGVKPTYPMRVPKEPGYKHNLGRMDDHFYRDAMYVDKSINAWDDGKSYWEIKTKRIPQKFLDLNVFSWEVWSASTFGCSKRRYQNNNFSGQQINIVALPSGQDLREPEPKPKKTNIEEDENQMTIDDWFNAN